MTDFEVGDLVKTPSGKKGEITKIDRRPGESANLLYIHTEEGPIKRPANLPNLKKIDRPIDRLSSGEFDDPKRFDLRTKAAHLGLAHRQDRFVALSGSRIEIEPYQVQAAHEILNSYDHRYLIGDEVGLGKTIEAAIVIEELIARNRAERVLLVVPAPLQVQWQEEMREKFDRNYVIYDRGFVDGQIQAHPNENVWTQEDRIITSIDFAKQEDMLEALRNLQVEWDIAVFDESHHLTARRKSDGSVDRTERYKVGEAVSTNTDGLIFLTGTPHKGKADQFYFMIRLLDRYRFKDEYDIDPEGLDDLMIRRLKEDMYEPDGTRMFPEKNIETLPVDFTEEERELYEAVTEYISEYYNLANREDNQAAGFAMVIYQKRLVSSIHAIQNSLESRMENIRRGGADPEELSQVVRNLLNRYRKEPEMLTDKQKERVEEELEAVAASDDPEMVREELEMVENLYNKAKRIDTDSKAERLREFIEGILKKDPDEKVLIFTEYTDTLEYLRDRVLRDYETAQIHGDLNQGHRRREVEKFRNDVNIMVATDAAREGINLQFAHIMVNYDLPWNPIRIDQRIGRLHRYGQEHTVEIRNLFVNDTRESEILEVLMEKIEEIESTLGMSSDVLGLVLEDFDLEDQIMDAIAKDEPVNEVVDEVDSIVEEQKEALETIEENFLIRDKFDLSEEDREILEVLERSREETVGENDVEEFVRGFFEEFGGEISGIRPGPAREGGDVFSLEVPDCISGSEIESRYEKATFTREVAIENDEVELIALDHPLVQSIIDYCLDPDRTGGQTTVISSEKLDTPGILFNYRLRYLSGIGDTVTERPVQIYVSSNEEVYTDSMEVEINSSFDEIKNNSEVRKVSSVAKRLREIADDKAWDIVEEFAEDAREERKREIEIKREYAKDFFENRIEEVEDRLERHRQRQREEDIDMSAPIGNAKRRLSDLKNERDRELGELEEAEHVVPDEPELINMAVIVSKK